MRVLLIERAMDGHRKLYLECLANFFDEEVYVYAPENVGVDLQHFFELLQNPKRMTIVQYWQWILSIQRIVRDHRIDVVHFLDGDSIMRFFGIGFSCIGAKKLVITYHHFFAGFLRRISYRGMNRVKSTITVVHTDNIKRELIQAGVKNVSVCQYPAFDFESIAKRDPVKCKERYLLAQDTPVIGIIGGMCRYKNIIPFLNVMKDCKEPFQLLICGSASDISEEELRNATASYSEKVTLIIRRLTDDEYKDAIVASDIIFCIYGYEFDGASGPLTDGVCAKKMILSCNHGSLGEIVLQNNLGITATCDDEKEIIGATEKALKQVGEFVYCESANKYRAQNNPACFFENYLQVYLK